MRLWWLHFSLWSFPKRISIWFLNGQIVVLRVLNVEELLSIEPSYHFSKQYKRFCSLRMVLNNPHSKLGVWIRHVYLTPSHFKKPDPEFMKYPPLITLHCLWYLLWLSMIYFNSPNIEVLIDSLDNSKLESTPNPNHCSIWVLNWKCLFVKESFLGIVGCISNTHFISKLVIFHVWSILNLRGIKA